jgi:hypothetical protein
MLVMGVRVYTAAVQQIVETVFSEAFPVPVNQVEAQPVDSNLENQLDITFRLRKHRGCVAKGSRTQQQDDRSA